MPTYQHVKVPAGGAEDHRQQGLQPQRPDNPIIPYIEGDGTGFDITPVMIKVVDAAVAKAYGGKRKIHWMEIYAGEKSTKVYGPDVWLPDETLAILKDYVVSIKGPLTTPVGGGIRSLNVALRQELDLYVCLRPVRYFKGVPSPVKEPEKTDMVIFRENSEDIYAGIEWEAESPQAKKLIDFLIKEMGVKKIRFPGDVRHRHQAGVARRHRAAGAQGDPVRDRQRPQVGDARAQGQHHEVHRRRLPRLGATRSRRRNSARKPIDGGPWCSFKNPKTGREIVVKDVIADAFLQQILLRPGRVRRHRHAQPQRRLHLGRARGAGRRHRHRAGRQPVRHGRDVRGDARHRAEVRRQGLRQSGLGDPVGADDAGAHGLEGGGGADRGRASRRRSSTRS